MAITKKTDTIMAADLCIGKVIGSYVGTYHGWGGSSLMTLGAGHAVPYIDTTLGGKNKSEPDDSIEGQAFPDTPVLTEIGANGDINMVCRYLGLDRWWYWAFGYEDAGSSPQSLGAGYYSHLYEMDLHERHVTPYRTAEQTAGDYNALDRKVRLMQIGRKLATNDYLYQSCACEGFSLQSKAGDFLRASFKTLAYKELRGSYNSAAWTFPAGVAGSALDIPHHHLTVQLGPPGALVTLGCSDISMSLTYPLRKDKDTVSGLYLEEPKLEGTVEPKASLTLSTHATDTYQAYSEDWSTALCMKWVWTFGSYQFGLYFPDVRVENAEITGDGVAKNIVPLSIRKEPNIAAPVFTFTGHTLIQGSMIYAWVKNTNSTNEMRRN